jgi:multicomponent K+:H+ antiporter subunit A
LGTSLAPLVLIPLLGAWVPALLGARGRAPAAWAAAVLLAIPLVLLAALTPAVFAGEAPATSWTWLPEAGLALSLRLDGLAWLFALLILGIGLLVVLYAAYYLSDEDPIGRFFAFLMLFAGAMLGVVLSGNLLLMVVFWELTSLSSFLLIGYWSHRSDARRGARMALTVTGAGGLALLAGVLLLGYVAGSFELAEVLRRRDAIVASPLYGPILLLVLLGAFTKSAQFPFHFWLPHAMAAPTPVSAYLHSATMVKAGVFLLARLYPALGGTETWFYVVTATGCATLVFAAWTALFKHDLKGLLAYSTISHLGLITMLFGIDTPLSVLAALFHIVNHATFKASLFMAAGIIDHETGTRDMRRLNGLWKYMPHTATLAMVAASAMAGVPLLNGFLSKEMFFAETLLLHEAGDLLLIVPVLATLAGVFGVAYSVRFVHDVFFNGEPVGLPRQPHEPARWMKIPVEVLVAICLVVGVVPAYTVAPLLRTAAAAALGGPPPDFSLAIWHGFNLPLLMSVVATLGGLAVYFSLQRFYDLHRYVHSPVDGQWAFERTLRALQRFAGALTQRLENGSLQTYLAWIVAAALVAGAIPLFDRGLGPGSRPPIPFEAGALVAWLVLAAGAVGTVVLHRERFAALILIGVVGLVITLAFAYFAAPDLALTQISVEVVTVVLLLLALHLLPQIEPPETSAARRARDAVLAGAAGAGITAVTWAVLTRPFDTISGYYLEKSVPGGGGTNVVNVILVDFRGFDTLGEVIVLAIAALGIFAMLRGFRLPPRPADAAGRPWSRTAHPVMLSVLTDVLLPLALAVSVYVFMRGHNLPGGGFVAGLIAGIAFVLLYVANGERWVTRRLPVDWARVSAAGVLVATATGAGSWYFGRPFLTSAHGHPQVPLLGEVPLATAMAFDLGVFLVVVGVILQILARLGETTTAPPADADRRSG